mgnify:CR=1 FL=1
MKKIIVAQLLVNVVMDHAIACGKRVGLPIVHKVSSGYMIFKDMETFNSWKNSGSKEENIYE